MYFLFRMLMRRYREAQATRLAAAPALASAAAAGSVSVPVLASSASAGAPAATRGWLALLAHQIRYDLLATVRNPRARFFTFLFPVLLLAIFASVFGHGTTLVDGVRVSSTRFIVGSILTLSIVNASYAILVTTVATARANGTLKRRRSTPAPAWALIGGQVAATVVVAMAMSAFLLVVARIGWGVTFGPGALLAVMVSALLGALVFSCLGYAVAGLVGSPEATQPIVQLTLLPLYFISGVWIPTSSLSNGLQSVASIFPVEPLAATLHAASVNTSFSAAFSLGDLAVLAAWGVGAAVFAARRFSWLPRRA